MSTVRSGRLDSFKRGPWARAFSLSERPRDIERRRSWNGTPRCDRSLNRWDLELYDVEFSTGTLNVVVNRPGGVDVEALTSANRTISEWLDANDPIPGRFTLDVSSPGLERRLRTVTHFKSAVGEVVTLRELRGKRTDSPPRGHVDAPPPTRRSHLTSASSVS